MLQADAVYSPDSNDRQYTYYNKWAPTTYKWVEGYPDGQPKNGVKFATKGGFYYSENDGPQKDFTITVSAGLPFGNIEIPLSVSLGFVGNRGSQMGYFAEVDDPKHYYKLYISLWKT